MSVATTASPRSVITDRYWQNFRAPMPPQYLTVAVEMARWCACFTKYHRALKTTGVAVVHEPNQSDLRSDLQVVPRDDEEWYLCVSAINRVLAKISSEGKSMAGMACTARAVLDHYTPVPRTCVDMDILYMHERELLVVYVADKQITSSKCDPPKKMMRERMVEEATQMLESFAKWTANRGRGA
jgi:hypothetical protein